MKILMLLLLSAVQIAAFAEGDFSEFEKTCARKRGYYSVIKPEINQYKIPAVMQAPTFEMDKLKIVRCALKNYQTSVNVSTNGSKVLIGVSDDTKLVPVMTPEDLAEFKCPGKLFLSTIADEENARDASAGTPDTLSRKVVIASRFVVGCYTR